MATVWSCSEATRTTTGAWMLLPRIQYYFLGGPNWVGRTGGYLCVANAVNGLPLLIARIGADDFENHWAHLDACREKCSRLARCKSHITSWQSRNLSKKKFGGAVRAGNLIFSFSGLSEIGDEIFSLALAMQLGHVDIEFCNKVAALSGNPSWNGFLSFLRS